jgi:ATP-binding cassette subfamily B protein RaxB
MEREINERLRRLSIIRVSVAHRPEIMSGADIVLRIGVPAETAEVGVKSRG